MADNKSVTDKRDRNKVSRDEDYELSWLEKKWGVTRERVLAAIAAVGNDREKVEHFIATDKAVPGH